MESHLAVALESTFEGFDNSVLKEVFSDRKLRLIFETVYRMGFDTGWRVREEHALKDGSGVEGCDGPSLCKKTPSTPGKGNG